MNIYDRRTKKLLAFSNLKDLADFYGSTSDLERTDLFFWSLGCPAWIPAEQILTPNLLKNPVLHFPEFPLEFHTQEASQVERVQTAQAGAKVDPPKTINLHSDQDGFRVIDIVPPTSPQFSPSVTSPVAPHLMPQTVKDTPTQPTSSPRSHIESNYPEKRRFKRYTTKLKVIVSNKQKTFLSYSKNISEGGILLEDRIPKHMFNEESEVYISAPNRKEIIVFRCLPIGDDEHPNRLKFQQSQHEYIQKLKLWLEEGGR